MVKKKVGKILYSEKQITDRAKVIANQIEKDYEGEELVLLATLKGSVYWFVDVIKNINMESKIDFISISSYGSDTKSSGKIMLKYEPSIELDNKNVIVFEDIVDSGRTLEYIYKYFENKNLKSLRVCTMLDKPSRRKVDINADYIGFEVEDLFIVGYGLDFNQEYRTLPYITFLNNDETT